MMSYTRVVCVQVVYMLSYMWDFCVQGAYMLSYTETSSVFVGRLVVVIDVNPSHGFWTRRLMRLFGHEGK